MGGSVSVWRNGTSKSIERNLLISVVELENAANALDCLQVLIALRVEVMERIWLSWISVGQGEVNSDAKFDFAASKDVLKERVMRLDLQVFHSQVSCTLGERETTVAFLQSTKSGHQMTKQLMLARGV